MRPVPRSLLQPHDLGFVEGLKLRARWARSGSARGERISAKKGTSIEFEDFRSYSEGDDLRHMDWNVLARLNSPVIRTYRDEEDLNVYLLLDASPSMDFGSPTKLETAQKLATVLGLAALNTGDALRPRWVGSTGESHTILRARSSARRFQDWLENPLPSSLGLSEGLRAFARVMPKPGLAILITDGMDPAFAQALQSWAGLRMEVWVVQVLADVEVDPDLEGDLRLIDAESGSSVEVTANRDALIEYKKNLREHCATIETAAKRIGGGYVRVQNNEPLIGILKEKLMRQGWIEG
ncbi:MAG TPA: DUF58 domain-containing protein [Fimbriimonadaceae bacterium]|nr:DUF58 domain-containing protein [Fimbriimonadaceae bacterium]HRJ33613.1 DUF58 domain-containing protein [Fimbriimonadaceae bacterium]